MVNERIPALLVLGDGKVFRGFSFGAKKQVFGEAVFSTAMTGYQETMTDPSYHKQIVTLTAPQIGNTGWNDEDNESHDNKIWAAGLVIRDLSTVHSSWRAKRSLAEQMENEGIPGVYGVDTRTLVRHLRNHGSIAAGIFVGEDTERPVDELVKLVNEQPAMAGADLSEEVSTKQPYTIPAEGEKRYTVVAYDMGIKTATPMQFAQRGIETVVVPANTQLKDIEQYRPDGVFVSNGPGDPSTADEMVAIVRDIIAAEIPFFGICFGNQILGRALGLETYKLRYGHRGVNVPVKNLRTGKIDITSQNHGFALRGKEGDTFETDFGPASITHVCLNDGTVEGVALDNNMAYSVQYHPESAAGPHDANPLFDQFISLMDSKSPNNQ
ncbi:MULTISPECIES: glutamine-hydrolyzing carbamoyl-phosphate synthase small subunit [Corynebacterium]|uniref:Carbamoyl phosphate synthase small chain n=1 Tax=Corynebacterium lipophilum TaxID=2804918 RepID=A0AAW5HV82_9CORY|nr:MULTISPECIES: glutamine-hydrolyzing carbamoyl-phosphate synthase small subunit [Corynebacterium]MCO6393641.1 glutamine-hydrolyzing carbamoyl-phosphate synthase small subunit [Corynebacterium lipophilum]MCQ4611221.1 glutamine-hydrolyzing carbamoyl-phosphate synthase small subunit [Corynebacterium sp. CCUG 51687]MCZ2117051.1 glutamine-hydrolyzing carbamoyl-phosphate synthase small subunit [Corynebacterium lipophilum]OIR45162.1 carbamoyl phosphate synthase small subunit [Corynebacterium sp. NML